jgi:TonB family protein
MFAGLERPSLGRREWLKGASLALHAGFLFCILRAPAPMFVKPNSVRHGIASGAVTQLYWTNQSSSDSPIATGNRSAVYARKQAAAKKSLTWVKHATLSAASDQPAPPQPVGSDSRTTASSLPSQAPPLGSPFGSLSEGSGLGSDVRPALPAFAIDPILEAGDLASGAEGDEVVEITIDATGTIVASQVLRSMGPAVDAKVLAVLQNWRFRPATRDGVAIPSKQDVHYHFKPR